MFPPPDNSSPPLFTPISTQIASVTGILLNTLLFIFTITCTRNQMKDYARVIRMHCVIEILLDIEIFLSVNQPFILAGNLYIVTFSPFTDNWPKLIRIFQYCYYWVILYLINSLPIDFYYRYMAVCKQKILSIYKLAGLVFLAIVAAAVEGLSITCFIKEGPDKYATPNETAILYNFMKWNVENEKPKFLAGPLSHPYAIFSFCLLASKLVFLYAIIIWTVKKINSVVQKSNEMRKSKAFQRAHDHILRVLLVQAFVPVIICLPIIFLIIENAFDYEDLFIADITVVLGIWYTPGKCLCTILVVPSYRNTFLWPITRIWHIVRNKPVERRESSY